MDFAAGRFEAGGERVGEGLQAADGLADAKPMQQAEDHVGGGIAVVVDRAGTGGDAGEQSDGGGMAKTLARDLVGGAVVSATSSFLSLMLRTAPPTILAMSPMPGRPGSAIIIGKPISIIASITRMKRDRLFHPRDGGGPYPLPCVSARGTARSKYRRDADRRRKDRYRRCGNRVWPARDLRLRRCRGEKITSTAQGVTRCCGASGIM